MHRARRVRISAFEIDRIGAALGFSWLRPGLFDLPLVTLYAARTDAADGLGAILNFNIVAMRNPPKARASLTPCGTPRLERSRHMTGTRY